MRSVASVGVALIVLLFADHGAGSVAPEQVGGPAAAAKAQVGLASYYWSGLHGRKTASGIPFDTNAMVAAHRTLPFGTVVRVTNLRNGRTVQVRIVDRGPVRAARTRGVIIDLSRAAARALGFIRAGRTSVRLEIERLGG